MPEYYSYKGLYSCAPFGRIKIKVKNRHGKPNMYMYACDDFILFTQTKRYKPKDLRDLVFKRRRPLPHENLEVY